MSNAPRDPKTGKQLTGKELKKWLAAHPGRAVFDDAPEDFPNEWVGGDEDKETPNGS